jgi:hypothetical protein
LLDLYFCPSLQQPITTLPLRFAFVRNFVRSFGCGGAVVEALWMWCVFPPSPAFHTGAVLSFFFFSPDPLSFRNCLFFSFCQKFPLLCLLKKRKPSVVVDSFTVFFAPFVLKFARLLLKLLVL